MAKSALFKPIRVGSLDLANRIVIAPMCQYSAENGCMNDWHLIHLGHLAISGAALLTIEATAVRPEGRITWADVGLWNDETQTAMGGVLESIRRWSNISIGVQLNHAGRKASTEVPWAGGRQFAPNQSHGWQTVAPSAISFSDNDVAPVALDRSQLREIREAFVAAEVALAVVLVVGAGLMIRSLAELAERADRDKVAALLAGEADANNAYVEINAGAGGTESQDWAEMLQRMYTRWGERHGFKVELIDHHSGEQAGIKSATLLIKGENAYGLRTLAAPICDAPRDESPSSATSDVLNCPERALPR